MRVAFVTFEYPPFIVGGAGVHAAHITEELAKLGHQVVVFTPAAGNIDGVEQPSDANLQVWHVPVRETIPFKALQFWINLPGEIKKAEEERKFDVIHINGLSYWFLPRRLSTAPHVLTVHHLVRDAAENTGLDLSSRIKDLSGENGVLIPQIEKRAVESVDRIIAVSNYTKDRILQTYNISPEMVYVVYNGVDFEGYTFTQEDLDETRKQLGLPDLPVILFVGRVDDPRKGLDVLIRAFRKVLDEVDATLLVVGKGDQTTARDLAGPALDRMVFTGFVDDVTLKKCYALCDLYVCPSRLEGFGLTILEAFAAEKPVVATRVGAIPELVHDGQNGILVPPDSVTAMATAIVLILQDSESYEQVGRGNAIYLGDTFSWAEAAGKTGCLYLQLRSFQKRKAS
jgi:glycosyltransferase involved in cell wall biosynthesis